MSTDRLNRRFEALKNQERGGLVTFVTAGDPDIETSFDIVSKLPEAGADFIELGMAFSDPMADGPAIQVSSLRALKAGITLSKTLNMVKRFREQDHETPIILMGYFNPIYSFGVKSFCEKAKAAGVDGLIVVDLPPEEDSELCLPARSAGLHFIRLLTPTSDSQRLPTILANASGFLYFVSIAGITGTASARLEGVKSMLAPILHASRLPVAVGFGIKTPEQARAFSRAANAAVVGTALVKAIEGSLDKKGRAGPETATAVLDLTRALAQAVRRKEIPE